MSTNRSFEDGSPALRVALTIRFLLELALLAGAATAVLRLLPGWWRWPVAILVVIGIAVLWGLLLSPKAPISVPGPVKLILEALLFLGVGAALMVTGLAVPAVIGVVIWAADRIAIAMLQG